MEPEKKDHPESAAGLNAPAVGQTGTAQSSGVDLPVDDQKQNRDMSEVIQDQVSPTEIQFEAVNDECAQDTSGIAVCDTSVDANESSKAGLPVDDQKQNSDMSEVIQDKVSPTTIQFEAVNNECAQDISGIASVDANEQGTYELGKLFVAALSPATTQQSFKSFYSQFGDVVDSVVLLDRMTGCSRCFGFVTFSSDEEAEKAMNSVPHVIDGKVVDVKRCAPRARASTTRLFISGILPEHTKEDFEEYFNKYGKVTMVDIALDAKNGQPRGFGFITFSDSDAVEKCVNERCHTIRDNPCCIKKALNKEELNKVQQNRMRGTYRGSPFYPPSNAIANERYAGWNGPQMGAWPGDLGFFPNVVPTNPFLPGNIYGGWGAHSRPWSQGGYSGVNAAWGNASRIPNSSSAYQPHPTPPMMRSVDRRSVQSSSSVGQAPVEFGIPFKKES